MKTNLMVGILGLCFFFSLLPEPKEIAEIKDDFVYQPRGIAFIPAASYNQGDEHN